MRDRQEEGRKEGRRDLESKVAFVKMIIKNRRDAHGRMRREGGNRSLGILGDRRDRVGKVNSERNREVSSRRES